MSSSGIFCHVALIRTGVSEEGIASIIKVTRIGKVGTMLAVTSNRCQPDDEGDRFLQNVGPYKSHIA
jgi:hypothetical protein